MAVYCFQFLILYVFPSPNDRLPSQPFSSILRAIWQYIDPESGIHHVTWSVRVHHDYQGHQPVDPVYITSSNEAVKSNLHLYDGDKYFLTIDACNGAGMCLLAEEVREWVYDLG